MGCTLQISPKSFWEVVTNFTEKFDRLLSLRTQVSRLRAYLLYSYTINELGAPLEWCVGFIYCTKIRMYRPGGPKKSQRSSHSHRKLSHGRTSSDVGMTSRSCLMSGRECIGNRWWWYELLSKYTEIARSFYDRRGIRPTEEFDLLPLSGTIRISSRFGKSG